MDPFLPFGFFVGTPAVNFVLSVLFLFPVFSFQASRENFLERLWAYLTIKDLLERVAKGEMNSCPPTTEGGGGGAEAMPHSGVVQGQGEKDAPKRRRRRRAVSPRVTREGEDDYSLPGDDEDYSTGLHEEGEEEGSGGGGWETGDDVGTGQEEEEEEYYYEDGDDVGDIMEEVMDEVGDQDIVICNNLERALFLSLKYEFVTPLTSLVVVKPGTDKEEEGDFGEAGGGGDARSRHGSSSPHNIMIMSEGTRVSRPGLPLFAAMALLSLLANRFCTKL